MAREFYVISEGTTDFEVLRALILNSGNLIGTRFKAKALWPGDRFAQKAGWSSMRNWCQEQASALAGDEKRLLAASVINPKLRNATIRRPTSSDKIGAALAITAAGVERRLVLQIDADIAEYLIDECPANSAYSAPLTLSDRRLLCANALLAWLGGHASKVGSGILLCVCAMGLETWILATHSQHELNTKFQVPFVIANYDHLADPEDLLVKLGYAGDGSGASRSIRKSKGLYATYGERLVVNLEAACARSESLRDFCNSIAS